MNKYIVKCPYLFTQGLSPSAMMYTSQNPYMRCMTVVLLGRSGLQANLSDALLCSRNPTPGEMHSLIGSFKFMVRHWKQERFVCVCVPESVCALIKKVVSMLIS